MTDRQAVELLLCRYVDALYEGSVEGLSNVLHADGIYAAAHGGELLRLSVPDYLAMVAARARPTDPRETAIDAIDVVGGTMASAKLRCRLFGRDYVDFLTLLKVDGRWWVMAKIFHYDERTD